MSVTPWYNRPDPTSFCADAADACDALGLEPAALIALIGRCPLCGEAGDGLFHVGSQSCDSCGYTQARGARLVGDLRKLGLPPEELEATVKALVRTVKVVADALASEGMAKTAGVLKADLAPFAHLLESSEE